MQSIFKLDEPITQYGKVTRLGDRMIGRDFVELAEDGRDASFVRVGSRNL